MKQNLSILAIVAGFTLLGCLPAVVSPYTVRTVAGCLFYLVLAHCFNLLGGHSGYLNLGQGIFVGLGAYGYGLCMKTGLTWWAALAVCGFTGLAAGFLLAPLLFRLKGEAFALVNLALLFIFLHLAFRLRSVTGGADGFFLSTGNSLETAHYGLAVLGCMATLAAHLLPQSRPGYQIRILGCDTFLAESIGIATLALKVRLFAFCASLLTAAGGLFIMGEGYIIPATVFGLQVSLLPVAMAMVGGLGRPLGPLWGTAAVFGIQEWLWLYVGRYEQSLLGLMLIVSAKRKAIAEAFRLKSLIGRFVNRFAG